MKVVVVHGHRDPGCTRISRECAGRVLAAIGVNANVYVFSGAGMRGERSEGSQMGTLASGLRDMESWSTEWRSETTAENARYGMREAIIARATHVVVVTSWWHVPRAWLEWARVLRRTPEPPKVTIRGCRGSWRYVPGELRALWGWRW